VIDHRCGWVFFHIGELRIDLLVVFRASGMRQTRSPVASPTSVNRSAIVGVGEQAGISVPAPP